LTFLLFLEAISFSILGIFFYTVYFMLATANIVAKKNVP
jgi:hypothetical protein